MLLTISEKTVSWHSEIFLSKIFGVSLIITFFIQYSFDLKKNDRFFKKFINFISTERSCLNFLNIIASLYRHLKYQAFTDLESRAEF